MNDKISYVIMTLTYKTIKKLKKKKSEFKEQQNSLLWSLNSQNGKKTSEKRSKISNNTE